MISSNFPIFIIARLTLKKYSTTVSKVLHAVMLSKIQAKLDMVLCLDAGISRATLNNKRENIRQT